MEKQLNIYFCGSIRGNKANLQNYQNIVIHLRQYGKVLTEHVAFQDMPEPQTDEGIFQKDLGHLKLSDIMIAEISNPSHGVGMELGLAFGLKDQKYPILCLKQKQSEFRTSAMISGCERIKVEEYENIEEAIIIIDQFFKNNLQK